MEKLTISLTTKAENSDRDNSLHEIHRLVCACLSMKLGGREALTPAIKT